MAGSTLERVAVLESEMRQVRGDVRAANEKLDNITNTLAQMSGGKKAVLGLFTLVGMAIGGAATIITAIVNGISLRG